MPDQAMEAAISDAISVMKANYHSSHFYRWLSRLADWVSFLLTATITIIVGSTGQVSQATLANPPGPLPPGSIPPEAATFGRAWLRFIGAMAATASVLIAISSRVAADSQEQLDRAEKMREVITKAREEYAPLVTPASAETVIDNLLAETEKHR